jgi:hypothetical protein
MAFETVEQITPPERPVDDHRQAALGGERQQTQTSHLFIPAIGLTALLKRSEYGLKVFLAAGDFCLSR